MSRDSSSSSRNSKRATSCSSRASLVHQRPDSGRMVANPEVQKRSLLSSECHSGMITKILGLQSLRGPPYSGSRQHYGYVS